MWTQWVWKGVQVAGRKNWLEGNERAGGRAVGRCLNTAHITYEIIKLCLEEIGRNEDENALLMKKKRDS